jgi:ribosomal protein S3
MERYGTQKFKGIGYKAMESSMKAGALGIEILISGKLPSSRAKRWRFYLGYLPKSGDLATENVLAAYDAAQLKTGTVGIQVRIMPGNVELPDRIKAIKMVSPAKVVDVDTKVDATEEAKIEAATIPTEDTDNLKKIKKQVRKKKADVAEVKEDKEEVKETSE